MRKHNSFTKNFKKQILSINISIERYLNQLKIFLNNLKKKEFYTNNKVILAFTILVILSLSYFLIPTLYNKEKLIKEIKNQISKRYNIEIKFKDKINYSLFPKPHFFIANTSILKNEKELAISKTFRVFISFKNLFSYKNLEIKDLVLDKADFNLDINDISFIKQLLNIEPNKNKIIIKNSNIFFRSYDEEVLFINKIFDSKIFYDFNNFENVLLAKNKIFNIPYKLIIKNNRFNKKMFSKLDSNKLRLNVENEINYDKTNKIGLLEILFINKNIKFEYEINNNSLIFYSDETNNNYTGEVNFKPFYFSTELTYQGLNFKNFFDPNSILIDVLNSEIFRNKNLNASIQVNVKDITNINELNNLYLNLYIREGDMNLSETNIMWKDDVKIALSESLINYNKSEINLTGKFEFYFKNLDNFYKSFQVKKKNRKKLEKIEIDFMYDLNQQKLNISNIKIDNTENQKIEKFIQDFNKIDGRIFNKITFKNFINNFFTIYSG